MRKSRWFALAVALGGCGLDGPAAAACSPVEDTGLEQIVWRVETEGRRYIFIGERHGAGLPKRFAADLANALDTFGYDVGLYVEGFRTDCALGAAACPSLARLFNRAAFDALLDTARVPVHPIDPPQPEERAGRMAAAIGAGSEAIRVVLIGRSHVVHAHDPSAELWVYGGGLRYPDPGDVVEAFPRERTLTIALDSRSGGEGPYTLRRGGCGADYTLLVSGG